MASYDLSIFIQVLIVMNYNCQEKPHRIKDSAGLCFHTFMEMNSENKDGARAVMLES
jgi:hypothetical protein